MQAGLKFVLLGTLLSAAPAFAQQPPDGPPGDRGGMQDGRPPAPPGPGRMLERLHEDLGVSEDQWPAMSAKIETIFQLEHELYAGPGGPGGRPPGGPDGGQNGAQNGGQNGGPNGGGQNAGGPPDGPNGPPNGGPDNQQNGAPPDPQNAPSDGATTRPAMNATAEAVRNAKHELGHLVNGPDATPQEVEAALKTLRDARAVAKSQLATAQSELKTMVNPSQQAMLVVAGILE